MVRTYSQRLVGFHEGSLRSDPLSNLVSQSKPSAFAIMLRHLDLQPNRPLEGWSHWDKFCESGFPK